MGYFDLGSVKCPISYTSLNKQWVPVGQGGKIRHEVSCNYVPFKYWTVYTVHKISLGILCRSLTTKPAHINWLAPGRCGNNS